MRPQTLNYWKELISARTQFEKNSVGNPARFAKTAITATWFENTKISYKQTVVESSVGGAKLSSRTVTKWFKFCRGVSSISMDDKYRSRGKIGGYGVHILKH